VPHDYTMNPVEQPYRAYECQACLRMQIQPTAAVRRKYCKRCGFPPTAVPALPARQTESSGRPSRDHAHPDVLVTARPKSLLGLP